MPSTHPNQVARIESVDAESFSFLNEMAGAFRSGESQPRPSHFPVLEGIRAVLARLQSAGRLVPAGGMALTAEQVEDVRLIASENYPLDSDPTASINRLRALFPATEPAEEETKAEYPHRGLGDLTVLGPEIFTNGEVINWRGENFVRQQDPTSSPVVPAPTETGPKTWCAITGPDVNPGGEHAYVTVRVPKDFVSGQSMADLAGAGKSRELARLLAPFVAAEEG